MVPERVDVDAALRSLLADYVGVPVGITVAPPEAATDPPTVPYLLVEPIPSGGITGSWADPHRQVSFRYDLCAVGSRQDQAQATLDRAVNAVAGRDSTGALVVTWPTLISPEPMGRDFEAYGPTQLSDSGALCSVSAEIVLTVG